MKKSFKNSLYLIALALLPLFSAPSLGAAPAENVFLGEKLVGEKKCAGCHNLTGPAVKTVDDILKKKGPDLFFAGNKFKRNFLVSFLQNPPVIRPSGTVYVNNVHFNGFKDELKSPPKPCGSKLSLKEAGAVADYLLTLTLQKSGKIYSPKPFSLAKARIIFEKNLACHGCHKIRGDKGDLEGGVSGPVLYNAGGRLKGEWVYSFLKNPQKWIPKIWMPAMPENEDHLQLITDYVMSMNP
ncbi:MAG: hypothetical protein ACE5FU_12665 [Nitrospinota bacterium]